MKINLFKKAISESISLKTQLLNSAKLIDKIEKIIYETLKKKNKVLICGNGGSAADAQHLAAEFIVRLKPNLNRAPLPVIPLTLDTSSITACGNDFSFDKVFTRPFEALAKKGDLLFVLSTSGNSKNIINVLNFAKKKKIKSLAFLGFNGGKAKGLATLEIIIKSTNVARIQECHMFLGHNIFDSVENKIFKKK
jgi:D-sedoheptulose 7-phosphate isomerase